MNNKISIVALIVALAALVVVMLRPAPTGPVAPVEKTETAYDRVIKTQTIRCGYVPFVPNLIKDPNTGAMSGIDYDIAEAIGHKLGFKIIWAEEVGWATVVPALKANKFDALCNGAWLSPAVAKEAYFSRPYYYQPLFIAVRADDTRFDAEADSLNDEKISVASLDGDNPRFIAEEDFPKAKILTLPDMNSTAMTLESVSTGKADATFIDAWGFGDYNEHNPGKLKLIHLDKPVRIYPVGFNVPMGDDRLRSVINAAMDELIYSGQIDKILKRYQKYQHSFIPVERPRVMDEVK